MCDAVGGITAGAHSVFMSVIQLKLTHHSSLAVHATNRASSGRSARGFAMAALARQKGRLVTKGVRWWVARREMCVKGTVYTWCVLVARALDRN
jgi:hypothetical protein